MNRRRFLGVVGLLAATAGCPQSERKWTLRVQRAYDEEIDGEFETWVEVAFGGQTVDEDVVRDVRVCALDGEGNRVGSASIDRMSPSENRTANVTIVTERVPAELVLDYGDVETDAEFNMKGMKREDDGTYSSFHQEDPRCGR